MGSRGRVAACVTVLLAVLAVLLSGCSSSHPATKGSTGSTPATTDHGGLAGDGGGDGSSGAVPTTPAPPTTAATKPAKVREIDGTCPYISTQDLANKVGSRVGRTTVLTSTPRGCKFYLPFADFHAVAQITAKTYPDETTAHNEMVRTAAKGSQQIGYPALAAGVEGVTFRTAFYAPDGKRDWACIFRKGRTVVVVNTDQNDTSFNARAIAIGISKKF
ncbi:MAG: hypothetical protein ACR2KJ_10895 [Jatrophihabitans sp.]